MDIAQLMILAGLYQGTHFAGRRLRIEEVREVPKRMKRGSTRLLPSGPLFGSSPWRRGQAGRGVPPPRPAALRSV